VNAPKPLLLTPNWSHVEQALEDPGRDRDVSIAAFIIQLVSLSTGVRADTIASGTRHRAKAARARQIAMYLTHTAMAWPLARVAAAFRRDRSTASYACRRVEDLRENALFEKGLLSLEGCILAAPLEASSIGALKISDDDDWN